MRSRLLRTGALLAAVTLVAMIAVATHPTSVPAWAEPAAATPPSPSSPGADRVRFTRLPLLFVENRGQYDARVRFVARQGAMTAFFTEDAFRLSLFDPASLASARRDRRRGEALFDVPALHGVNLSLTFEGSSAGVRVEGVDEQPTRLHYFLGNDPEQWVTDVPSYRALRYGGLYPGVDAEVYEGEGRLEYDLILEPGADLAQVVVRCEGAERLRVETNGSLIVETSVGPLRLGLPRTDEVLPSGQRQPVVCRYRLLDAERFGFEVPEWDRSRRLVIDPGLAYGSYLGGSFQEMGFTIAVDSTGSAYVGGRTFSDDFPVTSGAFQIVGDNDGFVAKLAPDGKSLIYATFLGGSGTTDDVLDLAIDSSGAAYLAGATSSLDFPATPNAFDGSLGEPGDAYAAKLDPTGGNLVFATLLGGNGAESAWGIAVDDSSYSYVTGKVKSIDFPTTPGAFDRMSTGTDDAFVVKVNPDGSDIVYGTYIGGEESTEWANAIAVDAAGSAYVTGRTTGSIPTDFPVTRGAFDTTVNGEIDAFVVKLNASGSELDYATYLGAAFVEEAWGIAVDADGAAYVTGSTDSSGFPTTGAAYDPFFNGFTDVYVTKLNPAGNDLEYSTLIGSSSWEEGWDIALDQAGSAYVTGITASAFFPTTVGAFDATLSGTMDAFVVKLSPAGDDLAYSTFLGGTNDPNDWGHGIAVDAAGAAYVTGQTMSPDFPTTSGTFDSELGGFSDAWVVKLDFSPWCDLGFALAGTHGDPLLAGEGTLIDGDPLTLTLSNALENTTAHLFVGIAVIDAPFKGGTLVPSPTLLISGLPTGPAGTLPLNATWPSGVPGNTTLYFQHWIVDPAGPKGLSASNAISGTTP